MGKPPVPPIMWYIFTRPPPQGGKGDAPRSSGPLFAPPATNADPLSRLNLPPPDCAQKQKQKEEGGGGGEERLLPKGEGTAKTFSLRAFKLFACKSVDSPPAAWVISTPGYSVTSGM